MSRKKDVVETPKKRGRPEKVPDEKTVEALAALGCTQEEMAAVLDLCVDTLVKHSSEAIKRGHAKRRVSLRRSLNNWVDRHVGAAIFVAKNELGMTDVGRIEHTGAGGGPIQQQSALYIVQMPDNGRAGLDHRQQVKVEDHTKRLAAGGE